MSKSQRIKTGLEEPEPTLFSEAKEITMAALSKDWDDFVVSEHYAILKKKGVRKAQKTCRITDHSTL